MDTLFPKSDPVQLNNQIQIFAGETKCGGKSTPAGWSNTVEEPRRIGQMDAEMLRCAADSVDHTETALTERTVKIEEQNISRGILLPQNRR